MPLHLEARMETQSILYRTLWLFAGTFLGLFVGLLVTYALSFLVKLLLAQKRK